MTGFGAGQAAAGGLTVRAELRTVNHKHLLVKLRLPSEASHLEPEVEKQIRKALGRGSVAANVSLQRDGGAAAGRIDEAVAEAYAERGRALAKKLGIDGELTLSNLLSLPGVVSGRDDSKDPHLDKLIKKAVTAATKELVAMREREGEAMLADLRKHQVAIERVKSKIAKRMPAVVKNHQKTLASRVSDLIGGGEVDAKDLAREVALLADKLDVSEEIARLEAHLDQLDSLLTKGGEIGRKLDFLAQEFFREANTVGSKCSDAKVTHAVVDLKTSIERLREQVQNVE